MIALNRRVLRVIAGVASTLALAGAAHAVPVVDQSNTGGTPQTNFSLGPCCGGAFFQELAQTFTVGLTGLFTGFDFWALSFNNPSLPLEFDVRLDSPTGVSLLGSNIAIAGPSVPSGLGGFVFVDLPGAGLAVTAGEVLAIVITTQQDFSSNVSQYTANAFDNLYAGGSAWQRDSSTPWHTLGADQRFVTYVDTAAAAPAPAPLALLAVGLFGLGFWRLRGG